MDFDKITLLQEPEENSWLTESRKANPHLGAEDLLIPLSRGNGVVVPEALDLDVDETLISHPPSQVETDQVIERLRSHLYLGSRGLVTPLSRGNGVLDTKEQDTDVDRDSLNIGFQETDTED